MRFPFFGRRLERRSSSATDLLVSSILSQANAGTAADVGETAAGQTAAALYEAAFEVAEWVSPSARLEAVSPHLPSIARSLILTGNWCGLIRTGPLRVEPAASWTVHGRGADSEGWSYTLDFAGPDGSVSRRVEAAAVLHFRRGVNPARLWAGESPLRAAGLTARMLAGLESTMADEANATRGYVFPIPSAGDSDSVAELKADLRKLRGKVALVETTASGWGEGRTAAPRQDWGARRIGAAFPPELEAARASASAALLAACGVPPALAEPGADGTASREAYRRFLHVGLAPLARIIAREVARRLDVPGAALTFGELAAADVATRARALASFVKAGLTIEEARQVVGV